MVRSKPESIIIRLSAKASRCRIVSRRIINELRTMFQRTGLNTPPCGAPANIQNIRAISFRERLSFRVEMKCRIQLRTFPLALVFFKCPLDDLERYVVKSSLDVQKDA